MTKLKQTRTTKLEIIARAIIIHKNKILLCRPIKSDWWFLPGGHVEYKEPILQTLKREIKEELNVTLKKAKYLGLVENIYGEKTTNHEFNLIFSSQLNSYKINPREKHIAFAWHKLTDLQKTNLKPLTIKKSFILWLKNKKSFNYFM